MNNILANEHILRKILRRIYRYFHHMISDQCISVSELSRNPSAIIRKVKQTGRQYVFVNNKPEVIILDIKAYEALGIEDDPIWTPAIASLYNESLQDLKNNKNVLTLDQIRTKYEQEA